MSSSRRRGRAPGPTVRSDSPAVAAPEIAEAAITETSAVAISVAEGTPLEASAGEETDEGREPTHEAAPDPSAEVASEPASTGTPPTETSAASSADDGAASGSGSAQVQDSAEADLGPTEEATVAPTPQPSEPPKTEAAEPVETMAATVAEAALLPALAEPLPTADGRAAAHDIRVGPSLAFVPAFAPLTEINARLFAFARGEGEAALAHFQALARAKSPAEAIRLQVTEMQRAADASLTCFSEIVRSANRLNGTAHRH